jgi:hypothetical protein
METTELDGIALFAPATEEDADGDASQGEVGGGRDLRRDVWVGRSATIRSG